MSIDLKDQYDKIYRYCYLRVHNHAIAEDLTQETFLRFLEHPQYHDQTKALQYLYTIAGNLCIDEYRKKPTEPLPEEFPEETDYEDKWITHIALQHAVASLTAQEREMVLLRYINEVPLSVLSQLYNMSRFALSRKLKKILSVLRKEFERGEAE
ncbi:MAG: sigma-70 family RNA polymerase sigma factor [Ruminococcus sp.]|nr:sigma-70 family RNA polymerase sigma factor [Ruminococcus sp.]